MFQYSRILVAGYCRFIEILSKKNIGKFKRANLINIPTNN